MRIGLIDADKTAFPNLALMKLSAYHKSHADIVEWVNYWQRYDRVYISKVLSFSHDPDTVILSDEIVRGGTGYNLTTCLPTDIESQFPDYSIYPNCDYAIGFLTRGCSRGCPFCIVKEKEGSAHQVASVKDFWSGQKLIKLLDPNILETPQSVKLFSDLLNTKAEIDFTQGLDIRLITAEHIQLLLKMKVRRVHFAYDQMKNQVIIEKNLAAFMSITGWGRQKVSVFILCNYDTTFDEDMHRVMYVKACGATPYVMLYNKQKLPKGHRLLHLQRWCNAPQLFNSTEWKDYKSGGTK